jgi:transcriptional regulator with XRE-family HTH domain
MSDLTDLGRTVREARKARGFTQSLLAEEARVSRALIAQLESGRLPELGIGKLTRILHTLGLDLRVTTLNQKRPTFEDLREEDEAEST